MKSNLTDVAEFLNYDYDNLVEYIQTTFGDGNMEHNDACEIADEMCDKMKHMGEIQSSCMANEKEATDFVDACLGGNA